MICARIELWRIIGGSWLSLSFFVNSIQAHRSGNKHVQLFRQVIQL